MKIGETTNNEDAIEAFYNVPSYLVLHCLSCSPVFFKFWARLFKTNDDVS